MLFNILQKKFTLTKGAYFLNIYYSTSFQDSLVLVVLLPHEFVCSPCSYYQLEETRTYKVGVASGSILFMPDVLKISQLTQKLEGTHREITW